ncbi:hypothetical protein K9M48_02655 [Candidatus Gracilibacteria bacterium]|nr:hypothetical protein [Candidatus Gracilibacteria bacterium]
MKKEIVKWEDFSKKSPPPHYLDSKSDIVIEYDDKNVEMIGKCIFPSSDPTLESRGHVNHFHIIMLIDVVSALNVLWNGARIVKEKLGWEDMLSITTESKITQKLKLDILYVFEAKVKKVKMGLWQASLIIKDQEKVVAEVITLAKVKGKN